MRRLLNILPQNTILIKKNYELTTISFHDITVMRGMNKEQQKAYLMEYMGWTDEEPDQEGADFWEPTEWEKDHPFE